MAWRWGWRKRTERLGQVLPRLTVQAEAMRRELALLSKELVAVHVALERVAVQVSEAEKAPILSARPAPVPPVEFNTERRQR
jgi:hypothetical protein